jgi:hypothetical protein
VSLGALVRSAQGALGDALHAVMYGAERNLRLILTARPGAPDADAHQVPVRAHPSWTSHSPESGNVQSRIREGRALFPHLILCARDGTIRDQGLRNGARSCIHGGPALQITRTMNQIQFNGICEAAARALRVDPSKQDGRYSFSVDEIEILMDFEDAEDTNTLYFYIDLGETSPH